jgi:hypothetical protein
MPQKQSLQFNFSGGLELKTDPKQIPAGKFLELQNSIFNTGGLLQKRNGFQQLTVLPSAASFLTTFNNNLTAISNTIEAYSENNQTWVTKGSIQPVQISTQSLIRSNTSQTQVDTAVAGNGFMCVAYTDQNPANLSQKIYKYVVIDPATGQNILSPHTLIATGSPRVFALDQWFVIVYTNVNALQFVAISIATLNIQPVVTITNPYQPSQGLSFDGVVAFNNLYLGFSSGSGGQSVEYIFINNQLQISSTVRYSGYKATLMGLCADSANIWSAFYDSGGQLGYVLAFNSVLQPTVAPQSLIIGIAVDNITPIALNNSCTVYYEVASNYSFDSSVPSNYIQSKSLSVSVPTPTSAITVIRSVGLTSKAFLIGSTQYILTSYQSPYQNTYFLINGSTSTSANPIITAKLAYQNGGGYDTFGLPSVYINNGQAQIGYIFKDQILAVNKGTNLPSGTQVNGIYAQTGINLVTFNLNTNQTDSVEIGGSLQLSGGFLWMYDGYTPVEQNFLLYPDDYEATPSNTGGAMLAQKYFYQVVYEWADNSGNIHRSAPGVPLEVDMSSSNSAFTPPTPITFTGSGAAGQNIIDVSSITGLQVGQVVTDSTNPTDIVANSFITSINSSIPTITISEPIVTTISGDTLSTSDTCSVTLNIPTLRLTYKIPTPLKITIYRWSTAQQNYYEVTSITTPILNDTTIDSIAFVDTQADNQILGNQLIYTTGGVVEDIGAPGTNILTLWQTRLWMVDAEDQNLLWYSKQVIENTPVEMSDLFTLYVAPTIGASGSTGPITALGAMDAYLIIFKKDAIYYVSGSGPDNTGANNLFTDPVYITSTVGSTNQQSVVLTPLGLMFQSDKGIWLLDRGLNTNYIGAPVETIALSSTVLSAVLVPGTNQVRFTMDSGITLMYDYYYQQWGTFVGCQGISSCIYKSFHTYLDKFGRVFQESPGSYLDGENPVLLGLKTGWLNLAGNQGYQRIYEFMLMGQYFSPHFLEVYIAYDFAAHSQQVEVMPINYTGVYGSDSLYGQTTPYGGPGNLEQWRIHTQHQKCQVFQIEIQEVFNPAYGPVAGAGFNLSGINCVVGAKSTYRPIKGATSAG